MQLSASTVLPCATSGFRFDLAMGVLPAPFHRAIAVGRAVQMHSYSQRTPIRRNRIRHWAIVKASAATEAPAQQITERPMNIVFVAAEVCADGTKQKVQDFHVIESVSVQGIDLATSARRWLRGARQAVWETSLEVFRLNWPSEVTVSIFLYLKPSVS